MLRPLFVMVLSFSATAIAHAHDGHEHPEAVILNEDNWDEHVPHGKEVDAIYGDAVLVNKYLTAVIANPVATRNANMTVRTVGGCLIDLSVNNRSSDQLSCFYIGKRKYPFSGFGIFQEHESRTENGVTTERSSARVETVAPGDEKSPHVMLRYTIENDDRFLTVATIFTNKSQKKLTVPLEDDIRADGGKEQMPKSPNGTHKLYWIHDKYWGQAYGFEVVGGTIDSNSNSNTSSLTYNIDGRSSVELAPGEAFELTRRVYPGRDLLDVKAIYDRLQGTAVFPLDLTLTDALGEPIANAEVEFWSGESRRGSGRADENGTLVTELPAGDYTVGVTALGIELTSEQRLPLEVSSLKETQKIDLKLSEWNPGQVVAKITDSDGKPIACKVEFKPREGTPRPYFGPETATFGVVNLRYAPHGTFEQQLPAGQYDVTVSHGAEYDAIFTTLKIEPGQTTSLAGKLIRSVKTSGWISADFHSHSSPSGDNTGSQLGRVLNLVCENIEFAPCTEHNRIETYEPEIEFLKIGDAIRTVSGMELTGNPLLLNHQNVFPLVYKPRTQDGGGPVTDVDPVKQIERIFLWDDRSEKLIQQNHPDIGWLFYDRDGDGTPDEGFERSHGLIDVMEIHPVQLVLDLKPDADYQGRPYANRIFGWLQLLNQGYRIPGIVNTDAHYNFHGSGGLRAWIQSSTDDPARIDIWEMIHASKEGRIIMSNGPYLEFSVKEKDGSKSAVSGQDLEAKSGKVSVHVRVQCPNWLDIDRVFLLVNGRPHPIHNYRRETHEGKFKSGVVKFDETLEIELDRDAHIIAVAGGEKFTLGKVMGSFWGEHEPAALSNPVFVDVDGNGFEANKDTLDHPLPVKFGVKTN